MKRSKVSMVRKNRVKALSLRRSSFQVSHLSPSSAKHLSNDSSTSKSKHATTHLSLA